MLVAEGVDDAAALAVLQRLDCDAYQGDLKARPAPADEVLAAAKNPTVDA